MLKCITSAAVSVAALLFGVVGLASPASADSTHHVAFTGGQGLYLHPSAPSLSSPVSELMSEGSEFVISCWSYGDDVYGDVIWQYGTNVATGATGYAADQYIDTEVTRGQEPAQLDEQGISQCGTTEVDDAFTNESSGDLSSWRPHCGESTYFDSIEVERWSDGNVKIIAAPNASARTAVDANAATIEEWHAIQDCVSGLYGALADSMWDQLKCHQFLALVPGKNFEFATGPTYDLESWHGTFASDMFSWVSTHCGNNLGEEPSGDPIWSGRPDDGETDLPSQGDIG